MPAPLFLPPMTFHFLWAVRQSTANPIIVNMGVRRKETPQNGYYTTPPHCSNVFPLGDICGFSLPPATTESMVMAGYVCASK